MMNRLPSSLHVDVFTFHLSGLWELLESDLQLCYKPCFSPKKIIPYPQRGYPIRVESEGLSDF